ncbi:hypothetical protein [Streptomyces polygonati]|uniref:hypothetical protein n=1 Tax=Streptomyces polygonati TaxID=1617087 RepID=UPI0036DE5885
MGLAMLRLDAALRVLPEEVFTQARDRVLATIVAAVPMESLSHPTGRCAASHAPPPPTGPAPPARPPGVRPLLSGWIIGVTVE